MLHTSNLMLKGKVVSPGSLYPALSASMLEFSSRSGLTVYNRSKGEKCWKQEGARTGKRERERERETEKPYISSSHLGLIRCLAIYTITQCDSHLQRLAEARQTGQHLCTPSYTL